MKPICVICMGYLQLIIQGKNEWRKCLSCGFTRKEVHMNTIDWTDPKAKVSEHFSVHEAIYLPTWDRMATESDGLTQPVKDNLVNLCAVMEKVRELLGCPITVHCMYRPPEYSKLVGGHENDVHTMGMAVDFDCNPSMSTDDIKAKLLPELERMGLRMENNGSNSGWIHIDTHAVIHNRYFSA